MTVKVVPPGDPEFKGVPYETPLGTVYARVFESYLTDDDTCWRVRIREPEVHLYEVLAVDGQWRPILDGRWQYVSGLVPFGVYTRPEKRPGQ